MNAEQLFEFWKHTSANDFQLKLKLSNVKVSESEIDKMLQMINGSNKNLSGLKAVIMNNTLS